MKKKFEMSISESDKKLLVIFLAICLLAASYFFVFSKGMSKAQDIEDKNTQKEQKVMELQSKIAREVTIRKETEELKEKEEELKEKYPKDMTEEKAMSIIRDIESKMDFKTTQIAFVKGNNAGQNAYAAQSSESGNSESDTTSSGNGAASAGTAGKYMEVTIVYKASYKGLKKFNEYVNKYSDRMTIPSINATLDDATGKLAGTATVDMYYLPVDGKDYKAPTVNGVTDGTKNVFGSK